MCSSAGMDTGTHARGMMVCSSSHASGCPMQHRTPLGRRPTSVKALNAIHKVCTALTGGCSGEALAMTVQEVHSGLASTITTGHQPCKNRRLLSSKVTCCCRDVQDDLQLSASRQQSLREWRLQPAHTYMSQGGVWASTLALMDTCMSTTLE